MLQGRSNGPKRAGAKLSARAFGARLFFKPPVLSGIKALNQKRKNPIFTKICCFYQKRSKKTENYVTRNSFSKKGVNYI